MNLKQLFNKSKFLIIAAVIYIIFYFSVTLSIRHNSDKYYVNPKVLSNISVADKEYLIKKYFGTSLPKETTFEKMKLYGGKDGGVQFQLKNKTSFINYLNSLNLNFITQNSQEYNTIDNITVSADTFEYPHILIAVYQKDDFYFLELFHRCIPKEIFNLYDKISL